MVASSLSAWPKGARVGHGDLPAVERPVPRRNDYGISAPVPLNEVSSSQAATPGSIRRPGRKTWERNGGQPRPRFNYPSKSIVLDESPTCRMRDRPSVEEPEWTDN